MIEKARRKVRDRYQWLQAALDEMERSEMLVRRRERERYNNSNSMTATAAQPARPPLRLRHLRSHSEAAATTTSHHHDKPDSPTTPHSTKIRRPDDGWEGEKGHRRNNTVQTVGKQSVYDEDNPKHFTVVNVGAGGLLYLKPSRVPGPNLNFAPAMPPATAGDASSYYSQYEERPPIRESDASAFSGIRTPRPERHHSTLVNMRSSQPPISLHNQHNRRRTRSLSVSTVGDRSRRSRYDAHEFQLPSHDHDRPRRRRRSSADLTRGELNVPIPHYRLGTPRFSERGTAYMHTSMYTNSSIPSSVLSRTDLDKLFPIPPGRGISFLATQTGGQVYLQPGDAFTRSTLGHYSSARPSTIGIITPETFNKIESNFDHPALVHYHPSTGKILAATPARLIAQVTSPELLDYELLADFFLTFRCFMHSRDLLDYLFARLRWAFTSGSDSGRVVRVRTFVALRHWILNYFADDFLDDAPFRQDFCNLVNELACALYQLPNRGGGDMNILHELKKCWRRTCALYWPLPEVLDVPPDAPITPGGEQFDERPMNAPSQMSLPLSIRPTTTRGSIFEMTTIQLPDRLEAPQTMMDGYGPVSYRTTATTNRTASIPASPLSEQSLEVLSCSVPFLRNLRPSARAREKASPKTSSEAAQTAKQSPRHVRHHKRSGSFSDALRDKRTPLSSPKADNVELKDLPHFAITGGLVRGLLLQPSTSNVDTNVPVTPGLPLSEGLGNEGLAPDRQNHFIVKKFVGDVRRALASRNGNESRSPARSNSSKGSRGSDRARDNDGKPRPDWQQLPGPERLDILALRIENAYRVAWAESAQASASLANGKGRVGEPPRLDERERSDTPRPSTARRDKSPPRPTPIPESRMQPYPVKGYGRMDSRVTNSSRSILIVDATGAPELPMMSDGLEGIDSLSSMSTERMPIPIFRDSEDFDTSSQYRWGSSSADPGRPPRTMAGEPSYHWRSSDARLHDLLASPDRWSKLHSNSRVGSRVPLEDQLRRSSALEGSGMQPFHHQLRRVPGGNLRDANHVKSLEMLPRPRSEGSLISRVSARVSPVPGSQSRRSTEDGGGVPPTLLEDEAIGRTSVSLLNTHSSQPILRASFEAEARNLKNIPDRDDEGGIEDALLKLEGKIPSPSSSSSSKSDRQPTSGPTSNPASGPYSGEEGVDAEAADTPDTKVTDVMDQHFPLGPPPPLHNLHSNDSQGRYGDILMKISPSIKDKVASPAATETQGASIFHLSGSAMAPPGLESPRAQVQELAGSEIHFRHPTVTESNAPAPLAEMASRLTRYPTADPYSAISSPEHFLVHTPVSYHSSSNMIPSMPSNRYQSFHPGPWANGDHPSSFLLDDNQSLSEISTEIADGDDYGARSFFFDDTETANPIRPFKPLFGTPPSTIGALTDPGQSPDRRQLIPRHNGYNGQQPGQTLKEKISNPKLQLQPANKPFPRRVPDMPRSVRSDAGTPTMATFEKHLPFILAFESDVIAEQLTIIEKDALDEVDWKDLISLNWQQNPPHVRNWVDFLSRETSNGIDIVIARFNLVVKWVISEIVLTAAPSERARAITKFIHIAGHCHRMHNYASLYQLTLALHSNELTRLQHTWSLVSSREKQMLSQLEQLCRPLRNFHNLRAEMETAMPGNGIIPFIGLYTHDLMFNALKSARIEAPAPDKEPLVNFERYQTAATIVKNLLRLIEASSKYSFQPETDSLSRCLWIAALEDDEISARSIALEKDLV